MLSRIPQKGHDLIANVPRLGDVARVILYSDQRYDGSGYPNDGVAGDRIPLGARLLKVVLDFVHRESLGDTKLQALAKLRGRSGWYDPKVLETAAGYLCPSPGGATDTPTDSFSVSFGDIVVGDLLTSNVETEDGVLIIQSGAVVTSTLLERMRNFVKLNSVKEPIGVERGALSGKFAGAV